MVVKPVLTNYGGDPSHLDIVRSMHPKNLELDTLTKGNHSHHLVKVPELT